MATVSSLRSSGGYDHVEEDHQAWRSDGGATVQDQINAAFHSHERAIDEAIEATYGDGTSTALRDTDANRRVPRATHNKAIEINGSGHAYSSSKRDRSRGQSAIRAAASVSRGKANTEGVSQIDRDQWIHRDKLTQIEIQEYRQMGLEPPPDLLRRAAESRQATSRDDTEALRQIRSPEPNYYNEEDDRDEEGNIDNDDDASSVFVPVDPRSPEEIAADAYEESSPPVQGASVIRKGNSKLPLASSSPVPVPQEHLDRDVPLPRKSGASSSFDADGIMYPKTRTRKGSISSQVMLDDLDSAYSQPSSTPASPSKSFRSKSASNHHSLKAKPSPHVTPTSKSRTTSTAAIRPGTSSGERPRTATNRPEGDPPWLASMYAPDPRLPPEQQMLPTHAKRLMQEQLERDGRAGRTFDRDFRPVGAFNDDAESAAAERARMSNSLGVNNTSVSQQGADGARVIDEEGGPGGAGKGQSVSRTPSPGKRANGGYSTVPRIVDSPNMGNLGASTGPRAVGQPGRAADSGWPLPGNVVQPGPKQQMGYLEPRVTGGLEEGEKAAEPKKRGGGCGCCVVM